MSIYLGSNMIAGNNGTISAETLDSVPVGAIVEFEGDEVPVGYEQIEGSSSGSSDEIYSLEDTRIGTWLVNHYIEK